MAQTETLTKPQDETQTVEGATPQPTGETPISGIKPIDRTPQPPQTGEHHKGIGDFFGFGGLFGGGKHNEDVEADKLKADMAELHAEAAADARGLDHPAPDQPPTGEVNAAALNAAGTGEQTSADGSTQPAPEAGTETTPPAPTTDAPATPESTAVEASTTEPETTDAEQPATGIAAAGEASSTLATAEPTAGETSVSDLAAETQPAPSSEQAQNDPSIGQIGVPRMVVEESTGDAPLAEANEDGIVAEAEMAARDAAPDGYKDVSDAAEAIANGGDVTAPDPEQAVFHEPSADERADGAEVTEDTGDHAEADTDVHVEGSADDSSTSDGGSDEIHVESSDNSSASQPGIGIDISEKQGLNNDFEPYHVAGQPTGNEGSDDEHQDNEGQEREGVAGEHHDDEEDTDDHHEADAAHDGEEHEEVNDENANRVNADHEEEGADRGPDAEHDETGDDNNNDDHHDGDSEHDDSHAADAGEPNGDEVEASNEGAVETPEPPAWIDKPVSEMSQQEVFEMGQEFWALIGEEYGAKPGDPEVRGVQVNDIPAIHEQLEHPTEVAVGEQVDEIFRNYDFELTDEERAAFMDDAKKVMDRIVGERAMATVRALREKKENQPA